MNDGADVIVVGAGLAGLVATAELAAAGRRVVLVEQEPEPWLGVLSPFGRRGRDAFARGLVRVTCRHRVDAFTVTGGMVDAVRGAVLEPSSVGRGRASSRAEVGEFELHAPAVILTSGGIGGN